MVTDKDMDIVTSDPTEGYQHHTYPMWIKLMFAGFIIWGLAYSGYFILTGFDSEARFDQRQEQGQTTR